MVQLRAGYDCVTMAGLLCFRCRKPCAQVAQRGVWYVRCSCTTRPAENEHTDLAETFRRRLEVEQLVFGNMAEVRFLALA